MWRVILAVETSILKAESIDDLLQTALTILMYGLGVAAVLGVIIAGLQYLTARDNEGQMAAAKKRLIEVAIGLVAWAVMFGVLGWLIPGGLKFGNSTGGSSSGGSSGGSSSSSSSSGGDSSSSSSSDVGTYNYAACNEMAKHLSNSSVQASYDKQCAGQVGVWDRDLSQLSCNEINAIIKDSNASQDLKNKANTQKYQRGC